MIQSVKQEVESKATAEDEPPCKVPLDLSGEWPIVGGVTWMGGMFIPMCGWYRLTRYQRRKVTKWLAERGRLVREQQVHDGRGMVHVGRPQKAEIARLTFDDVHICIGNEAVRHYDIVSVRIDNVSDRKEALAIFREWLADLCAVGLDPDSVEEFLSEKD